MNTSSTPYGERTIHLTIRGMHCKSCEVLIEKEWKNVPGVRHVNVNQSTGKAVLRINQEPDYNELNQLIQPHGYTIVGEDQSPSCAIIASHTPGLIEIGAMVMIVAGLYYLLKTFDLLPVGTGLSDGATYAGAFVMGLVASASTCAAVTGSMLLALSAYTVERLPSASMTDRMKPQVLFIIGRVLGYAVGGALLGMLGSLIQVSPQLTGIISLIASIAMIVIGVQLLNIVPWIGRLSMTMPKSISHGLERFIERVGVKAPIVLGVMTFVLPCGFTQALQLSVLSHGTTVSGALTMLLFALGTLPALLVISVSASVTRGWLRRRLITFAGVTVIMVGMVAMQQGWFAVGFPSPWKWFIAQHAVNADAGIDPNVEFVNGKQVVRMKVRGLEYTPSRFRVREGIPVEWHIDGTGAGGCSQVLVAPRLNLVAYLPRTGEKVVEFTPTAPGEIHFSCSMGMTTPNAAFVVVSDDGERQQQNQTTACDPRIADCLRS